ncbi:helix-turn-helix domain-containing protein [Mycobacterium colombiense]
MSDREIGASRGEVARHVEDLSEHIRALPGVGAVVSAEALREMLGVVNFVASLGGRTRRLSARMEALRAVLEASCRVDATKFAGLALSDLRFEQEFDTETAAELLGLREDTLRKYLRAGRVQGRIVNGRWLIPLSAITECQAKAA